MTDQSCYTCAKRDGTRCRETHLMVHAGSGIHCSRYEVWDRQRSNRPKQIVNEPDAVANALDALHRAAERYRSELGLLKLAHALDLSPTLIAGLESDLADRRRELKSACAAFDAALEAADKDPL